MGKHRRERSQRLVDMSPPPETQPVYTPPPVEACRVVEYPIDLGDGQEFVVRQNIYKGLIVDFAIVQLHDEARASDGVIARIDTCHGSAHRHRFNRQGGQSIDPKVIEIIPVSEGWKVVNDLFAVCWDRMMRECGENLRVWRVS